MNDMATEEMAVRSMTELRSSGLLWLINKAALHPRGYALALHYPDGADPEVDEPSGWSIMGDGSEPWQFGTEVDDAMFAKVEATLAEARTIPS